MQPRPPRTRPAGAPPEQADRIQRLLQGFATNPTDARSKPSFVPSVTGTGGSRQLGLVFRRRGGSCLDYFLDGSPDLAQWSSASASVTLAEPFANFFDGTGTGRSECRLTAPIPSQPAGFLRMRAAPRAALNSPQAQTAR